MNQALGPVHAQLQTFLAFDFGLQRTGVATGNRLTRTATAQRTIQASGQARLGVLGPGRPGGDDLGGLLARHFHHAPTVD
jgi:hypothetical protein